MTVYASAVSTSASHGNDSSSLSIEYIILNDTGAVVTKTEAFGVLPAMASTVSQESQTLTVTSRSVTAIEDSTGRAWRGTANYTGESTAFVALDMTSSAQIVDVWRVNATAPSNLNAPAEADIGGTSVDSRGTPVSIAIPVQELSITNFRSDNNASAIRAALGKRNSASWLGAATGYVLFTGATARRVGVARYEVQYKFVFDAFAHCRQVCAKDVDGDPFIGTLNADQAGAAGKVYWKQPFPTAYDFSSMGIVTA